MKESFDILIVDGQAVFSDTLKESLASLGYSVNQAFSAETALDIMHGKQISIVFIDVFLPDMNGFDFIRKIKSQQPQLPIIIMSAHAQSDYIKRSIEQGAQFLSKPFKMEDLTNIINRIEQNILQKSTDRIQTEQTDVDIYLKSKNKLVNKAIAQAMQYADNDKSLLIKAMDGTGRQKLAYHVHRHSIRRNNPFVIFNCSALPGELTGFHIFGYEKNAFKGAGKTKLGLIDIADKGTLFLEDAHVLPEDIQQHIVQFIQSGSFSRAGADVSVKSNVRIICSTSSNAVKTHPLPFHMSDNIINLPPLKRRIEDLDMLIENLLNKHNIAFSDFYIDSSVMNMLRKYPWPGNIFELEDLLIDSILLTRGKGMFIENLPVHIATFEGGTVKKDFSLNDIEKQHILNILIKVKGNKARAARILGVDRKTLYRKISKYGLKEYE